VERIDKEAHEFLWMSECLLVRNRDTRSTQKSWRWA